jgi:Tfp pilus assembly protein PilF
MSKNFSFYVIVAAIVSLSVLIYGNTLHNTFINFDDIELIVQNKYIRTLSFQNIKDIFTPGVTGTYQPIRTLSYALDYHFWKMNPTGYHLTNIFWNAWSTFLVYLLAYTLTGQFMSACFASLVFAVHPIHVEAVTWLSGRRDVLSLALVLVAFYCFLRWIPDHWKEKRGQQQATHGHFAMWYGGSLVFFTLGLLAKPSVIIFPLLLLFSDLCFLPGRSRIWRRAFCYIPFFLLSFGFMRIFVPLSQASRVAKPLYHGDSAYQTFLIMLQVFGEYIGMMFVPRHLSVTYGVDVVTSVWEPPFLKALAVFGVTLVLAILAWKKARIVSFGIGWFFIGLIPVSNIIPISTVKADRYLYLPSVGFCLALAWSLVFCWRVLKRTDTTSIGKKWILTAYWVMIVIVMGTYTILTIQRNRDWKDSLTLWTATLETTPDSAIALNNLGIVYAKQGMYDKAIGLFTIVIERYPFKERMERVYCNIAKAYTDQHKFDRALEYYQQALELNPDYQEAYLGLGDVRTQLGEYQKAVELYRSALKLNPQNEIAYYQFGNLFFAQEKYDQAISYYQKARELNPFYSMAYHGLGLSYTAKNKPEKAIPMYQRILEIDPSLVPIHVLLGDACFAANQMACAVETYQQALKLEPDNNDVIKKLHAINQETE